MKQARNQPVGAFAEPRDAERLLGKLPGRIVSVPRALAGMVALMLTASAVLLWTVPWVQTAAGAGTVIARDPADRVQAINALVSGRVNEWYVHDGSVVKAGDPIVEITDVDPNLVDRLEAERAAVAARLGAARLASETAKLNYDRQKHLFADGLSSRKDFEAAKIKHQEQLSKEASARAALNKTDIGLSRQSSQLVRAPRDGRIVHIVAGNTATLVQAGDMVASFAPNRTKRAVQVFVSGLDAPLVEEGAPARVMFEGWPAVQFSGWPQTSLGTFGAIVAAVDPNVSENGRFRVLLTEDPDEPWPEFRYLRLGAKARAWVRLSTVRLGYELWRQLNQFPPERPATGPANKGTPSS
ncbi:MAG: efflux RND transporter periplasmic adaptor subunit [Gammaproteobacteria bacterium]|jgi:multidrug efflux pump subunit AcrA (membrane-fusion protein)